MKRWQIEQILSLNEIGKPKLAAPDAAPVCDRSMRPLAFKKEPALRVYIRRLVGYLLNIF